MLKRLTVTLLLTALLATLTCSLAYSASGEIWLAGYLLLRLRTPTESKAFEARVDTVQLRANNLLDYSSTLPKVDVRKVRGAICICAANKVFLTVSPADARCCGMTVSKLANCWAQRLRTILPQATPVQH